MKTVILSSDNTNIIQGDFFIISSDSSREEEKNTHKKSTPDPNNGISESFDFSFVCLIKKEEKKRIIETHNTEKQLRITRENTTEKHSVHVRS